MGQKYPEPTVGALIFNERGEMLIVKSPKWSSYTIPGGHIEVGETVSQAVEREVKEEIGMPVKFLEIVKVQEAIFPKGFHKKKHFIFIDCLCKAKGHKIKIDGKEITDYKWVEPVNAMKIVDEFTRKAIEACLGKSKV